MKNKFICRGISKETGKFVYGYPIYTRGKFFVFANWDKTCINDLSECKMIGVAPFFTEITQEPDRWTELYDKNKNKIWESDIIKYHNALESLCEPKSYKDSILLVNEELIKKLKNKDYSESIKVIGNTHFNKELLEKENE
jgi:GH18 family chitinase